MWPQPSLNHLAVRIPLVMLSTIFVAESAIMAAFALTSGAERQAWLHVVIDASVLTLTVAPVLYFVIVRPLRVLAEERSQLLAHTFEIQDAERQRLARDLHDEIGQSFTSLMVQLRVLEEAATLEAARAQAKELRNLSGQVYDQIRSLARGLHPTVLDDLGLAEALRRLAEDFEATHGTTVALDVSGLPPERLDRKVETAAYRVVQESLTNCAKHAQATQIEIAVAHKPGQLSVTIADNGRGFDVSKVMRGPHTATFGLTNMRERALLLKGSLAVRSRSGRGTSVELRIPLRD
jgi:signal transduction histidine kinase